MQFEYNKEWCDENREMITQNQRIACAANRHKITGRIICGARHWDAVMRTSKLDTEEWHEFDQGFMNQYCEFLTREEDWKIAEKNNQIIKLCYDNQKDCLYSENIV